jgi:hypothetical protein
LVALDVAARAQPARAPSILGGGKQTTPRQKTGREIGHIMKRKLVMSSRRYASALRKHLKQGAQPGLRPARDYWI